MRLFAWVAGNLVTGELVGIRRGLLRLNRFLASTQSFTLPENPLPAVGRSRRKRQFVTAALWGRDILPKGLLGRHRLRVS
jgi:hypothetical protein